MDDLLPAILSDACQLTTTQPVLVGVSGGPDSLCLMDILDRFGYPLVVAHLNHSLRPEADQEAELVARTAHERGFRLVLGEENTRQFAQDHSLSLEEAARTVRYRFLFENAELYSAQAVAVAHTADDQVETVLMHFLRGAGVTGLIGMPVRALPNPWSQEIPLVRPLLSIWREAIMDYCEDRALQPVHDSSNQDRTYFRNRLRHELLPYLARFNPAIKQVILRSSEVMRGDYEIILESVEEAWQACVQHNGQGFVAFDSQALTRQSTGMKRRLIRRALAELRPGLLNVGFQTIDRALEFLANADRPGQVDLVSNVRIVSEHGGFCLVDGNFELPHREWPQLRSDMRIQVKSPGIIDLNEGWQLRIDVLAMSETTYHTAQANQDPYQAWMVVDLEKDFIFLRTLRPGDRIQPMGMATGTQKLSDFMINHKLPRGARRGWPLVCVGEKIAWVPGYRLGQGFQLQRASRTAIYMSLNRINNPESLT